jgi:hypothetical protein
MSLKFSIRQMLWATVAFSLVATAMPAAYRGNLIATGLLIGPLFMAITFAVFAVVYWLCYLVSSRLYPPIHSPVPADGLSATQPAAAQKAATQSDGKILDKSNFSTDADISSGASE